MPWFSGVDKDLEGGQGPPFYSRDYVVAIANRGQDYLATRMRKDCFEHFNTAKDGVLTPGELQELVAAAYATCGLPAPPNRLLGELRAKATPAGWIGDVQIDLISFQPFFRELLKGLMFKLKRSGFELAAMDAEKLKQSPRREARSPSPGRVLPVSSECVEFPIGETVEVLKFNRCLPLFATGAKTLRLTRFQAARDRLPPGYGLTVVGSYEYKGREVPKGPRNGSFVVGVRHDDTGDEFLVESSGLRVVDRLEHETAGHLLARKAAAEICGMRVAAGGNLVRRALQEFADQGILGHRSRSLRDARRRDAWEQG